MSKRRNERIVAASLLLVGIVGGAALLRNAVKTTSDDASGTSIPNAPVVDPETIVLPDDRDAGPVDGPSTLVIYDPPLQEGDVLVNDPEFAGVFFANLAGHFGPVTTMFVDDYERGQGAGFDGVVYAGAFGDDFGDNILPESFVADVRDDAFDLLWVGDGVEQLARYIPRFDEKFGWEPVSEGLTRPTSVTYKGTTLPRDVRSNPANDFEVVDSGLVEVLATASRDGSGLGGGGEADYVDRPYAVRSRNLTYLPEIPFGFLDEGNYSLVAADLLFDLLDPGVAERHQALVRFEDVGPTVDVVALRAAGEALAERGVPFSMAVYPVWRDPLGRYGFGTDIRLAERPEVVETLKYLESVGGTIVMHGYTHQYLDRPNPYGGVSGEDFEFYLTSISDDDSVVLDGPVEGDSPEWTLDRVRRSFAEFEAAGLDAPTIWEFPHYLASPTSYRSISPVFDARYEQVAYFPGALNGEAPEGSPRVQYFPYPVYDVYGENVIPESLGNIILEGINNNTEIGPDELIERARNSMVVRDNVASFFFHPYIDVDLLTETVDGITALGYDFVSPNDILDGWK